MDGYLSAWSGCLQVKMCGHLFEFNSLVSLKSECAVVVVPGIFESTYHICNLDGVSVTCMVHRYRLKMKFFLKEENEVFNTRDFVAEFLAHLPCLLTFQPL